MTKGEREREREREEGRVNGKTLSVTTQTKTVRKSVWERESHSVNRLKGRESFKRKYRR